MIKRKKRAREPKGPTRLRLEIVEMAQGLNRLGMIDDRELEQTTLRMIGRGALPKVPQLSAKDIVRVRERVGVSQAVLAGFLNVGVQTVSQWERGTRRPAGSALKLLHVVKDKGLSVLQ